MGYPYNKRLQIPTPLLKAIYSEKALEGKLVSMALFIRVGFEMGFFEIPNPDRDFLFWARTKNRANPEIPGIGIEIRKSRINSE